MSITTRLFKLCYDCCLVVTVIFKRYLNVFFQKIFTSHNNEDLIDNSKRFVPKLEFLKDGLGDWVGGSNQVEFT